MLEPLRQMTEAIELRACLNADAHELRFIKNPQAVVV